MVRKSILVALALGGLLLRATMSMAQLKPAEGSIINSRLIGFSFPKSQSSGNYFLEVATGAQHNLSTFRKHNIYRKRIRADKQLVELPFWDTVYTWRVVKEKDEKKINDSLHHFSTGADPSVDTSLTRLRILQQTSAYKDHYVLIENPGIIYDMHGSPVWYLPQPCRLGTISDMELSADGTLTYISGQAGYEISHIGDIMWQTPPHDTVCGDEGADNYHHHLQKLPNGHYLTLGTEYMWCQPKGDSCGITVRPDRRNHIGPAGAAGTPGLARFGIILELDQAGKVAWYWRSSTYLLSSDFLCYMPVDTDTRYEPHDNACFFDEKNHCIYLGFRNLGRIIKIGYPNGKVLATYGERFTKGKIQEGNGLFHWQHTITRTADGYLCIFNNNLRTDTTAQPAIQMLEEATSAPDSIRKVWEYTYAPDPGTNTRFTTGGSVVALKDGSFYVCMGVMYPRHLIVNRQKKILWSALPETYDATKRTWSPTGVYRSIIISPQEMARFIFHEGRKASH